MNVGNFFFFFVNVLSRDNLKICKISDFLLQFSSAYSETKLCSNYARDSFSVFLICFVMRNVKNMLFEKRFEWRKKFTYNVT